MGWSDQVADSEDTEGGCLLRDKGLGAEWVVRKGGGPARGHGSGSEDATGDTEAGQLSTGKA